LGTKVPNMKQLLQQYSAYNVWANKKILERLHQLSAEEIHKEIPSSFPSVYKTVLHITNTEYIWWQRLKLAEHIESLMDNYSGSFEELSNKLLHSSKQWEEWVKEANEANLSHTFAYQNNKKEQFKQPVYEMLVHLFNHQSYHRGQLVMMLRQLGADKIPQTDFIIWSRKKG
jgi:uncharacterized damage-inducible protein DinB